MIDWGDTLRETEQRAAALAQSNFERESGLRAAIGGVGNPQNPVGDNSIETTLNKSGVAFLRCDRTLIDVGLLAD